jgi:peptidoglycan hydrolase-like protein with peptidoglycan-binding domain
LIGRALALATVLMLIAGVSFAAQMLEEGASGETVTVLTKRLADLGYMAASTDKYDAAVADAVGDFQTANGLSRTGVADVKTQQVLHEDDAVTRQVYMAAFIKKYQNISLKTGDKGSGVKTLQNTLAALGYYTVNADGVFGEGTRRAVISYQKANGLEPTGEANASTLIRLFEGQSVNREDYVDSQTATRGDAGANVRAIQDRLHELGYFKGDSTGTYGEITARAVVRFQAGNGLTQTGAVDAATYEVLFSDAASAAAGDGALYYGDSGDEVFTLQTRLSALGFFVGTPNGAYGRSTEAAVMLFCAANGLPISGDATGDVIAAAMLDAVARVDALAGSADGMSADALTNICLTAKSLVGQDFQEDGDQFFPGFGLARYVFAKNGIAISEPGEIITNIGQKAYAASDVGAGDILVFASGGDTDMTLSFAICVEPSVIVYLDSAAEKVATRPLAEADFENAYVWDFGAVD